MKSTLLLVAIFSSILLTTSVVRNQSIQTPRPSLQQAQDPRTQASSTQQPKPDSDSDVVRVDTDLVTALFTVVDKDRHFITTLRPEDVRIAEDGTEQQVVSFERETNTPLSLAILVDTSGSQERSLPELKRAAHKFVEAVVRPDKDRISVVSFTGRARLDVPFSNDLSNIEGALSRLEVEIPPNGCLITTSVDEDPRCYTSIWDAVYISVDKLLSHARKGARRSIILLTDGDDTSSRLTVEQAIEAAVKEDVVIYGIGIGDRERYAVKKKQLTRLSEKSGGRAFFPRSDADLSQAFTQIQEELRSQYEIAYVPTNRAKDGSYRKVQIDVVNSDLRKRKLRLLHREGYYAKKA